MKTENLSDLCLRIDTMLHVMQYKKNCIKRYRQTWDNLQTYMASQGISFYSRQVGDSFLNEKHNHTDYKILTDRQKERFRHIEVLSGVMETGQIPPARYNYRQYTFSGELGIAFNHFIEKQTKIKKKTSITRYRERINNLYRFLLDEGKTIKELDTPLMIRYINKLDKEKSMPDRDNIIMSNRVFVRHLCEHGFLSDNRTEHWMSLMKIKHVYQKKIPSVYTLDEVEAMIKAIDRGHPQGKRDYAMVLLAAKYGLRVSDIIGLRFCNLDWEHNRIVVVRQKTGKKVSLPLMEEVGNAIIEYIKYGRPDVELPYVFITAHAPYKELTSNGMGGAIADYFRIAGVNLANRKHGPHSLRHTLASNLLKSNETLPVISEILGHASTDTTMAYLRIDINHLRQCALDVPFVPSSFYENLYE
jgi:site-specific recombinase XerD